MIAYSSSYRLFMKLKPINCTDLFQLSLGAKQINLKQFDDDTSDAFLSLLCNMIDVKLSGFSQRGLHNVEICEKKCYRQMSTLKAQVRYHCDRNNEANVMIPFINQVE